MEALRIRVVGSFAVDGFDAATLGSRKARTLLKVLALARGAPVSSDRLVECCWGDAPPGRPGDQLSVLVSRLRGVIGRDRIPLGDGGYRLIADWLDLDAVEQLALEARRRLAEKSPTAARAAADAALALVRGPLLADEPDAEWLPAERRACERVVAGVMQVAAEASAAVGDQLGAIDAASRALEHDPYDEVALRTLMTAYVARGRPASALSEYARVRTRLAEDLGVDPTTETEALHTAILRGDSEPSPAAEPAREGPEASIPVPIPVPIPPGRGDVLAWLDRATAATGPVLIELEGEAGIGKTRVLEAWTDRIRRRHMTVLSARCAELDRALPLQVMLDALSAGLRELDDADAATMLGSDAALLAPLLQRTEDATDGPVGALTDAETGRLALFAALLAVVRRLAERSPVVLVLDDAHLAGPATIDWLHYLRTHLGGEAVSVVAARRPGEGLTIDADLTIELGPLDHESVAEIVGSDRAEALFARSGGHPLFLVELADVDDDSVLPSSIVASVRARCERAGASGETLRTAAIIGSTIDLDLLAAVTQESPVALLGHLEDGVHRRFLLERNAAFVFAHDLIRDALVEGTSATRRALVHREASRALQRRAEAEPLDVAFHARLGGDRALAARAYAEAAGLAMERFDHATAAMLLDQAIELHDLPGARVQRARVAILMGRYDDARIHADAAMSQGAGAAAFDVAGWAAYFQRDFERGRRLADDGVRLAEDREMRASCLVLAGRIRHADGDLAAGEQRLQEAVDGARGSTRMVASVWLGTLRSHQGRADEALELLRPGTYPGYGVSHTFAPMHAHMFIGHALGITGRAEEALRAFERFGELVERQHAVRFRGRPENFTAWVLRNLGHEQAADEQNQKAMELGPEVGLIEATIAARLDLADGALTRGEFERVDDRLTAAEQLLASPQVFRWRQVMRQRSLRARWALETGRFEEAAALGAALHDDALEKGIPRYRVMGGLLEARASGRLGLPVDLDEVAANLERLVEYAGLEAWWITAETARDLRVDRWWEDARTRVAELAAHSGEHRDSLVRFAERRLSELAER